MNYLSTANRDILVTEDGSFTQRYVYDENSTRISAEYGYAAGTKRGEGGENLQSDFAANDVRKVWYRTSHLGSTLFAVDENGKVISHTIYDPWGKPLTETYTDTNFSGLDNANNFTGYTWDEVLGLYFAQNRFYDAENHRFTQEDPIKDGENWYRYCGNEPLSHIDWNGEIAGIRVICKNSAILWSDKGYKGYKLADLSYKDPVLYTGIKRTDNGADWAYVLYNTTFGWINADFLGNPSTRDYARILIANKVFTKITQKGTYPNLFNAAGFFQDSSKNYHARQDAAQRFGGYNDFYDFVFDRASSMQAEKLTAKVNGKEYVLWAWKGYYLNLGAGAELGIYTRFLNTDHWYVDTSLVMPMSLQLTDKNGNIIVKYNPTEKQWWITGFNPFKQGYYETLACNLKATIVFFFLDKGFPGTTKAIAILSSQKILRCTLPSWKKSRGEINIFSVPIQRSLIFTPLCFFQ